ncbi:MAG: hypothetical protein Aurels2KO_24380 [Aureliella sp.]
MAHRSIAAAACVFCFATTGWAQHRTAIDDYVSRADDSYQWKIVRQSEVGGVTSVIVDMTSQTWLTSEQVDRPVWKHWVNIAIPRNIRADASLLMISGGSNGGAAPETASEEMVQLAKATGTIVAELKMVPNQALVFHGDGVRRKEDDLIGYTWDQFLKTGEADWLARNAMVKSAVRAMDTVQAVAEDLRQHNVKRFVVAGASKRGWTTWLTGAMDDRVVGIVPIVIDVLNVDKSMRHHFAAYGYWAPAIGNYVQHRIMQRLDHPRLKELYELVDPLAYRDRLDMPKLMLNAAGDQFFLPDSSQFYLDQLPGETNLRYVANADHSMRGSDAIETLMAFYFAIAHDVPRPEFVWSIIGDKLRVESKTQPVSVVQWSATNPTERDFRLETLGAKYTSQPLEEVADGIFEAPLIIPDDGWTAQFVELTFDIGAPVPLKLTTPITVLPEILPYSDRDPALQPSVTLKCLSTSHVQAVAIAAQARGLMEAKLSISDVKSEVDGSTFYLNWQPDSFEQEAGPVMGWLESQQGCKKVNIQLESGRNITTTAIDANTRQ